MIIIEPHADDAFLSVGQIAEDAIKKRKLPVTIVTVYSATRKRGDDARRYAEAIGAEWVGLPFKEAGNSKASGNVGVFSLDDLSEVIEARGQKEVWAPLGIGDHPEHLAVRDAVAKVLKRGRSLRTLRLYVDQPYAIRQKHAAEASELLRGRIIAAFCKPHARKWRHIPIFKDQAKFFHFNPVAMLAKTFEMVVVPPGALL